MKAKRILQVFLMIGSFLIFNELMINQNIKSITKKVQRITYTTEFQKNLSNNKIITYK